MQQIVGGITRKHKTATEKQKKYEEEDDWFPWNWSRLWLPAREGETWCLEKGEGSFATEVPQVLEHSSKGNAVSVGATFQLIAIVDMFFRILAAVFLLEVVIALPQGIHIGKDGTVGASWGGYSASAGLGGILGGAGPRGGLHAQAGTPDGHFAAAGLGGSVSEGAGPQGQLYSTAGKVQPVVVETPVAQPVAPGGGASSQAHAQASASASSGASGSGGAGGVAPVVINRRPGSFFDDIFNIPISTLGAVNQYLNNRHKVVAYVPTGAVQQSQSSAQSSASASASSSGASSSANSAANAGTTGAIDNTIYHGYHKNYNDIFNIPISVLGAVNRFLNGKK